MAFDVAETWMGQGEFALEMSLINEDRFAEAEELFASTHEAVAERGQAAIQLSSTRPTHESRCWRVGSTMPRLEAKPPSRSLSKPLYGFPPPSLGVCLAGWRSPRLDHCRQDGNRTRPTRTGTGSRPCGVGRALILDAEGDPDGACRSLASAWERLEPVRYFGTWPSIGSDLVRLHLRAGDRTGAEKVTTAIESERPAPTRLPRRAPPFAAGHWSSTTRR